VVKRVNIADLKSAAARLAGSSPASRTTTMKQLTYIFDVDKTIMNTHGSDYTMSVPFPGRIEKVNALYDQGHKIIYWTARGATTKVDWYYFTKGQLDHYGCKYHEFKTGKPHYNVWVDDKAINAEDFF